MKRNSQRGSAMLVTMIIITSLLAGAAVLVSMQLGSNRASDLARTGISATYCAEAGLDASESIVAANYSNWGAALIQCGTAPISYPCPEPTWLSTALGNHDIDGDGIADFAVYIKDNDDEFGSTPNDLTHDSDLRVFIVSRCTKYADSTKEVEELVEFTGGGSTYRQQKGFGTLGNGNQN